MAGVVRFGSISCLLLLLFAVAVLPVQSICDFSEFENFDVQCLAEIPKNTIFLSAFILGEVTTPSSLKGVNISAVNLPAYIPCSAQSSQICSQLNPVQAYPSASSIPSIAAALANVTAFQLTDSEIFALTGFDSEVQTFCDQLTCLQTNLNAYQSLSAACLEDLQDVDSSVANAVAPYIADADEILASTNCDNYLENVSNSFRVKLNAQFWQDILTPILANANIQAYDAQVTAASAGSGSSNCDVPQDLVCVRIAAELGALCQLTQLDGYVIPAGSDVTISNEIDGLRAVNTPNYNVAFQNVAKLDPFYPCHDLYSVSCYSQQLVNIPDLNLTSNCRSVAFYDTSSSPTQSPARPSAPVTVPSTTNTNPTITTSPTNSNENGNLESDKSAGLSGGATAAIVIIVLLVVAAVAGFIFYKYKRGELFASKHDSYQLQI